MALVSSGNALSLNLFHFALSYVSATFATALVNTVPAITLILALCFRMESLSVKQRHGMAKMIGSTLGLSGALLCTFVRGPAIYSENGKDISGLYKQSYSKSKWIMGSLIIPAANTAWCLWFVMQGPLMKQYPSKLRLTALQCLSSCALSAIWAAAKERDVESWKLGWNVNLLSVFYCGMIATAVSYSLLVWIVEKKGPVFSSLFSPLELFITATLSAVLFQETLHWEGPILQISPRWSLFCSVSGAILLVIGLYGILWGKNEEGKTKATKLEAENKEAEIEGSQYKLPMEEGAELEGITCER